MFDGCARLGHDLPVLQVRLKKALRSFPRKTHEYSEWVQ